jgi:hypothetical protein
VLYSGVSGLRCVALRSFRITVCCTTVLQDNGVLYNGVTGYGVLYNGVTGYGVLYNGVTG